MTSGWRLSTIASLSPCWWEEWDAINSAGCDDHPALASLFAQHLLDHFHSPGLMLAEEFRSGNRTAMAVLHRRSAYRWTIFSPSQAPLPLIVHRNLGDGRTRSIGNLLSTIPWPAMVMDIPGQDLPYSLVAELPSSSLAHVDTVGNTIAVSGARSFDEYWEGRPKHLQQNIRRYLRRLQSDGIQVDFRAIRSPDEMHDAVGRYGLLESAGWKGALGTAVHPDNVQGLFYGNLLRAHAAVGKARAYMLYFNDALVAGRLAVCSRSMAVMLKTTYDESYARYAPGRIMLHHAIADLLNEEPNQNRIEFYTRANRDALDWATETREIRSITVYRNALAGTAARLKRALHQYRRSPTVNTETPQA